jgi:hypothetical protein
VICPKCQAMNESTSAFCRNCGTPLASQAPPQEAGPYGSFSQPQPGPATGSPRTTPAPPGMHRAPEGSQHGTPSAASEFRLDLRRLSRVDQTVGIASLVVFIALLLPWYGLSEFGVSFSISGTSAHGYLVIALIVALLLVGYLLLRAGWDRFPLNLPLAHGPLLVIGTGLQFLLVIIGFFDKPSAGLDWEIGAYLALIAAVAAAAQVIIPAVRSWQESQ